MKIDKEALDVIKKISEKNERVLTLLHCFRLAYSYEGESSYVNPEATGDMLMELALSMEQILYDSFLDDDVLSTVLLG